MLDKLAAINARYEDVSQQLTDPGIISDMKRYKKLTKEYKDLGVIVEVYKKYRDVISNITTNKEILKTDDDAEMKEMAKMELDELEASKVEMDEEIKMLLIPKDPEDAKNAIFEIRAGTGGDEAGIFAGDLFRMYSRYFQTKGWKTELLKESESSSGGYKEISMNVIGNNVYGELKYEAGVHRVQRVPKTESQGRVHTSAATVAVLPEADEFDVEIKKSDLRRDTYRASGAGGQHVNKTESAIRLTHLPTGIVAECQDGRSQMKNEEIAMKMLYTRIYEAELRKRQDEVALHRKTLVSTGDRSAKIRTYNWPQGRVTDHRINLTLYHLDSIIGGDIQGIIDQLKMAENAEKLKAGSDA
ncbi:UNVERIFIED_CONTAM: hypothetical protein GTU68_038821 [Idotea baltica]|nr:hypothetical protein [Idotea baltica]